MITLTVGQGPLSGHVTPRASQANGQTTLAAGAHSIVGDNATMVAAAQDILRANGVEAASAQGSPTPAVAVTGVNVGDEGIEVFYNNGTSKQIPNRKYDYEV